MIFSFFSRQSKTIGRAAFWVGLSAFVSRLLGMLRDRLLAGQFGAGDELDIYFAAFRLPDFIYSILITGAVSAAFIPLFSQIWHKNKKQGWLFTSNTLNVFLAALILMGLIFFIFTPQLINLIAPGFSPAKKALTINLSRLMFFSPLFFALSAVFSSLLTIFRRFLVYALAPIMYNLGIIFGIIALVPMFGLYGLGLGVVLGAFLHMIIQVPALIKIGFRWQRVFSLRGWQIDKVFALMVPRSLGLAAHQINFWVITALSSLIAAGNIAVFNLANNLQYVPIGVVGISFAVAAFPCLAKACASQDKKKFIDYFRATLQKVLFLAVPIGFFIFLTRAQIVRLILGTGRFSWSDTRLTAACLGIFSLAIFAQALVPLLARFFYAQQDTKTPVVISVAAIILNIFLSILLFRSGWLAEPLSQWLKVGDLAGKEIVVLPLAFSVSALFNLFCLLIAAYAKIGNGWLKGVFIYFIKILLASLVSAVFVYLGLALGGLWFDLQYGWQLLVQFALASLLGLGVYWSLAKWLKLEEIKMLKYFSQRLLCPKK